MSGARASKADVVGVVLAGGAARRMGGDKMRREVEGRPLVLWAVDALRSVLDEVVVLAKSRTLLPPLPVPVWIEPDDPLHPLAGVATALERASGAAVLVCAGDIVDPPRALLRRLLGDDSLAPVVVPRHPGGSEPLLALYRPAALPALRAGAAAGAPARRVVEELGPRWIEGGPLRNLNH